MLKKVTNYLRNVGKSLGYALNDVVQEDASEIKSFLDTNSHIIRDAYKAVKDYRTSVNKVESSFKNSKIYVAADIGIKAVFEDLANGTFYNKERENEIDAKYSGFDMSDDFDLEAFEKGLKERDKNLTDGDKAIVESVEKANRQSASLISDTIARTTNANIQNQRAASRLLYLQNTQIINGVRAGVDTLNEVGKTINVSNAMFKTIADNQKQFFTDTSKVLKEMHAMQKELLEMQRNVYEDKRQAELSKQRNKRKGYNDVFDSSGVMDLEAYGEIVKENFNRALSESEVGGLFTGMGLGKDSNLLASFAASPLKMLTQSFVKNLIPKVTREATQSLNATFSGLFGTMVGKLNNMATNENSNMLMQTLGKIFGVKPKSKTDVQTNKFQKGPVPFDGIVKKAIVDVIPGYLRRIEAALTGKEGRIYDYDSGRWTALNNYIDTKEEMVKSSKRRATGDFRAAIDKYKKRFIFENEEMEKEFNDFFDAVMLDIGTTGNWTRYARAAKPGNEGLAGSIANNINPGATYGADYVRIIGEMMRQAQKYNKTEFRGAASNLAGNIARAQEQLSRTLEDLELKSSPILTALEEGNKDKTTKTDVRLVDKHGAPLPNTVAGSVLKTRDKYDKDVFDYLRSLDIHAEWIRNFAENGGFGTSSFNNKPQNINKLRSRQSNVLSDDDLRELLLRADFPNMSGTTEQVRNIARSRFNTYSRAQLIDAIRNSNVYDIEFTHTDELDRNALITELSEMSGLSSNRFNHLSTDEIRRRHGIAYNRKYRRGGASISSNIANGNGEIPSFSDIIARRESEYNKDRDRTEEALRREEKEKKSKAHQDRLNEYRNRGYQVVSPRDLGGDSGFSVYGEYTAPLEQMYMTDEAKKKNAPKERSWWEEIWGIRPFTVLDDEDKGVKDFFTRLKDAKSIGDKFTVIKQSTEKLAAAPMTMLTKVIQKADEAVYHFMFADQDDDRDEDDQHPKGLMHKIVTEIKKTFAKLNEWINEKLLDPIKNWFQKKGINKPSDVLDKLTGGSYSDIKEAIASTIFGEKNADGKREGGWAQPFREAFGYNADKAKKAFKEWDEVKKQREKDKEEKQKRRDIEYNRDDRDEEDIIEDERMHAMAQGTSGVTKTDIYTMLSEGEYVTDPFGKKTRVSKADEMYPHKILKGSLIENPAGRAKRNAQEKNEILRREQFFKSIGVNADAADTTAFRDYERVLFPGGAQEKMEFLAIANGLEDRINDQINETGQDEGRIANLYDLQDRWYKLAPNYQAIKNPLPAGMTRSDYMSFITKNKCKDVINFVRKATQYLDKLVNYRDLDNIRNVSAQDMIADAAKQKLIDPEITIKGLDPSKNQWIKKQLSKVHYGTGDETKDRRVRGIADTTAKGAFGALGGLLVGNPLLGAGIGLLTGIAKNNKEMNTFLFGEGDEDGIISKKTQETFRKAAPDIKKLGIGGAVAGLLTGLGPIPGILLGGALGFAKNNNELMETLFGPEEERAEKFKKFKEEALPRMGIGAAAGALLGPFGLLGGALLGSGAGLLTTTNTFKDIMFGDEDKDGKRHGGIMGAFKESFVDPLKSFAQDFSLRAKEFIRDNIVDPIKGAMKPLANAAKHIAVDAIKFVPRLLDKVFTNFLGIPLGDTLRDKVLGPLGRLAKNIIGAPAWLAKQLLKLPGTIIGGIGNAVRASQIRRGRAEYMSAEERLNWRDEHQRRFKTGGLYSLLHPIKSRRNANSLEMDQRLAQLDDKGAEQAYNDLNILLDTEKSANKAFRKSRHDMNVFIDERFRNHGIISTKNNKDKILKKLQDGKIDEALKLISTLKDKNGNKLSGDDLVEFEDKLREYYNTFMEMKERKNLVVSNSIFNKDSVIAGLEDYVKKSGIKGFNLKTRAGQEHLRALLKKEKDVKPGIKDDENHKNGALLDPDEVHQNKMNTMFLQAMHNIVGVTKVMADSIGVYDKDPEAYRKISEGVNTVYGDVKDIENKLDENGNPVDPGLSEVAHKVAKSMEPRMVKVNKATRKADKIIAKHTAKGEILKSSRSDEAIKHGYHEDTEATSLWSSDDPRVNKVFDIAFASGNMIDINAALGAASIKKNGKFTDNLALACKFAGGSLIDAERIGIIAKIEHSTTMPNAFKKANAYSIPLFNSDIFQNKDQIMAVLGVSKDIMNRDTYKDALKEIKHRCDVYGHAPSAAEIKAIFNDVSARKNSTAAANKFAERTKGFSQAQKDQVMREAVFDQVSADDDSDMESSGSIEDIITTTTNANANHLSRFVKTNATIGELAQSVEEKENFINIIKDPEKRKLYMEKRIEEIRDKEIEKNIKKGMKKYNRKLNNQLRQKELDDPQAIREKNMEKINEYINNNTARSQSELEKILYELQHIKINSDIDLAIEKEKEKDRKIEKKNKEKEDKEKNKQDKKQSRHNVYKNIKWYNLPGRVKQWFKFRKEDMDDGIDNLNKKVIDMGDKAADKGNSIFEALSHPIKTIKGGLKGSKEQFEKNLAEGRSTSFVDMMKAMVEGQKEQIKILKEQDKEEGKTPIIKKIFKFLFGKSLVSVLGRTVGVPLLVGFGKNYIWPAIKDKVWPWMYNKLLGDPNVDGDGLLGKAHVWFKDKIVPKIFGTKNKDGVWEEGLFSGLANWWDNTVHPFLFGTKNEDGSIKEKGIFVKIYDVIMNTGTILKDGFSLIWSWLTNKDYDSTIFGNHTFSNTDQGSSGFLQTLIYNWADGAGTIVEFATKVIVKSIPTVLKSLLTGVVEGVKSLFGLSPSDAINKRTDKSIINSYANSVFKKFKITKGSNKDELVNISSDDSAESADINVGTANENGTIQDTIINASGTTAKEVIQSSDTGYVSLEKFGIDKEITIAEYNEKYAWMENLEDTELSEAIELSKSSLVILPADMFESKEAYKEYFDNLMGEGSYDRYGWDMLSEIKDPMIIPMDSDLYKIISDKRTVGEIVSESTFRYIINVARGGKIAKIVPALRRATTTTLTIIAKCGKLGGKIPILGKAIRALTLPASAGATLGNIASVPETITSALKVGESATKEALNAGFTAKEAAEYGALVIKDTKNVTTAAKAITKGTEAAKDTATAADKLSKFPAWIQRLAERFEQGMLALKKSAFVEKFAKFINKPKSAISKAITKSKVKDLALKFAEFITKHPKLAKIGNTAIKVLQSATLKAVTADLFIVLSTVDVIMGVGDAKTILGVRYDESLTPFDYFLAAVINVFVNEICCGLLSGCDFTCFFMDHVILGLWPDAQSDYITAYKATGEQYKRFLESSEDLDETNFTREDFLDYKYPSAQTLMEKDWNNKNYKGLAEAFKKAYGIDNDPNNFFAKWADYWAGGMTQIFGHGKKENNLDASTFGKGHIDQRASNMRYNAPGDTIYQTVADSGCGPAAAATVLSQYGKGKVEEAAQYSLDNGYKEPNGGTYPGFFGDYLGQNGIDTQYETTATGVMNSLRQGNPVVLMGSEYGKSTTPYAGADGSHYVTATGLDRNGNMIIEDPDDRRGSRKYNAKNVLNNTSIAISTRARTTNYKTPKHSIAIGRGINMLNPRYNIFGKGSYNISDIAIDGLQDLRIWKDPGKKGSSEYDKYKRDLQLRIYQASRYQTSGLFFKHSEIVARAALEAGIATGMDPALLLAIAFMESGFGSSDIAKNDFNFWGWNVNTDTLAAGEGWDTFGNNVSDIPKAFLAYAKMISRKYYDAGQKCLYTFYNNGGKHQYSGDINDITTDWVVEVSKYMAKLHKAVGQTNNNLSWHDPSGAVVLLTDLRGVWNKTIEGYDGRNYMDEYTTSQTSISSDLQTTNTYNGLDSNGKSIGSRTSNLMTMIADMGKKILKSMFGDVYELLFGSLDTSDSEDNSGSYTSGHYNQYGAYIDPSEYEKGQNATDWFTSSGLIDDNGNSKGRFSYDFNSTGIPEDIGVIKNYIHKGIDYAAPKGTHIISPIDGTVLKTIPEKSSGGYGNLLEVTDKYNPNLTHFFAHMAQMPFVNPGDTVERGKTELGVVGNTGIHTGNANSGFHLHYQINDANGSPYGYAEGAIHPDKDYNWARYMATIDPKTGKNVSKLNDEELVQMIYKEQEDYYKNTYSRIQNMDGQSKSLEEYNKITSDSVARKELRKRKLDIEKSGGYSSQEHANIWNNYSNALELDLNDYYKRHGIYNWNNEIEETESEENEIYEEPTRSINNKVKLIIKKAAKLKEDYDNFIKGGKVVPVNSTLPAIDSIESAVDFILDRDYPETPYIDWQKAYTNKKNAEVAIEFVNKYIQNEEEKHKFIDQLNKDAYATVASPVKNTINNINDYIENDYDDMYDDLEYVMENKDMYPNFFIPGDELYAGSGKGKNKSTSVVKQITDSSNIRKLNNRLNKLREINPSDKSLDTLRSNIVNKSIKYIKKYGAEPMAIDSGMGKKIKSDYDSFGTGKRPVIKNAYGKATPTMTQVKLRPQTTTKTEVKVEAPTNNIGLSQLNYTKFLITIIEALGKIADNTEKLDKVIMLLKTNGPKLGIDTSGLGKAKTNAEKLNGITSSLRNHKIDPSWSMAAMDRNNDFNPADAFMENIYRLASE